MKKPQKPPDLKPAGSAFWDRQVAESDFDESHDEARLGMACKCLDEISEAEEVIKKTGMFIPDRYGGFREHPAVKLIKDNRIVFLRIIRELGLDLVQAEDPRVRRAY
jgi:phage terminase small subunit